jgi:serine/threonine-protein phosphatase PGAM5
MTTGVRTLYLVRHGAYDIDDPRDEAVGRGLLPLGVAQARVTGDRLRGLPFAFDAVSASPLTRARETAEVIAAQLGGAGSDRSDRSARSAAPRVAIDPDLAECTPPTRRADIMAEEKPEDLAACSAQLERLAPRLLAPLPGGSPARRELVVAHGNVIRWLVTRALGVDTTAWLSMSIGHASVTTIAIDGKGAVRILAVGDVGHLPPGLQTGAFGNRDKWDLEASKVSEAAEAAAAATGGARPIVLMISFDGFRWDYRLRCAGTLALAREGARESLVPRSHRAYEPLHPGDRPAPQASRHRCQYDVGSTVAGGVFARRPRGGRGRALVGGRTDLGRRRAAWTGDGIVFLAGLGGGDRRPPADVLAALRRDGRRRGARR